MLDDAGVIRMYRWPAAAAFGRSVPKAKVYAHGRVSASLQAKFVDQVRRITWAYKLADATVRLKGSDAVPEIQVFVVEAKGDDITNDVLAAIDKSVYFPIIFEVANDKQTRMVAAYKTLGGSVPKLGPYLTTGWVPAESDRKDLPAALGLASLYEAMLGGLVPFPLRVGETVSAATDRMVQAKRLQRQIATMERRLRAEPQLNRKVEIRRQLIELQASLVDLTGSRQDTERSTWTS